MVTDKTSRIVMVTAAMSLAATPIVAEANTRASTSPTWSGPVMSYAAMLCAQQSSGCILPLRAPAPAPQAPVAEAPVVEAPAAPVPASEPARIAKRGFPWLPVIGGLGLLLGGIAAAGGGGSSNESNGAN